MLHTKLFRKRMEEKGLWATVKPLIDQSGAESAPGGEDMPVFIGLLDEKLPPDERLAVMEELGCCKSDRYRAPHKAFYRKYADRTWRERVLLMDEIDSPHKAPTALEDDGTLRVFWNFREGDKFTCVCSCSTMRNVKESGKETVSATYCACCGGHVKELWQTALGVKLRLKEVVSSAVSTGGTKGCEFLFDVSDPAL